LEQGGAGKRARPDGFAKAAVPAAKRPALAKAALPKAQKVRPSCAHSLPAPAASPLPPCAATPCRQASAAPGAPLRLNEYLGRRVKMYWPQEGGWFEAIITDYNMAENEHCLTYNMNTGNESFEWVNIAVRLRALLAGRASACTHSVARHSRWATTSSSGLQGRL